MARRHSSARVSSATPAASRVGGRGGGGGGGRGNAHRAAQLAGVGTAAAADSFEWGDFDPAMLDTARATHTTAIATTDAATAARDAAATAATNAHAAADAARAHESAVQAAEAARVQAELAAAAAEAAARAASAAPATTGLAATDAPEAETEAPTIAAEGRGGQGTAGATPPAGAATPPSATAPAADGPVSETPAVEEGPSESELAAQATAEAEAQAAAADGALAESETALGEATASETAASEELAATEVRAEEAEAAAAAAAAAENQTEGELTEEDLPVVGEDVTLAQTLKENPEALALMGLEQYADRPEVAQAAAEALWTGDWEKLQEVGLSKDEARAVYDTVDAVRISLENSSHVVDFEQGTVVDDRVGRDEVVIPGVSSWDEVEQTRKGDDLILRTADGEVTVVGYFDGSRGNVKRLRLADCASDDHADSTLYRTEMLHADRLAGGPDEEALAAGAELAVHVPNYLGELGPVTDAQRAMADTRNRAMYDWGTGVQRDVRSLMFGSSNRDDSTLKRGHKKVMGRYQRTERVDDPRTNLEDLAERGDINGNGHGGLPQWDSRDGASAIRQADLALQDFQHFSTLDAAGKKRHIEHIAKKGQKSSFFGKVLGIISAVVSFINPIVGAILQGVAVVAQGGSILDGIKAGLGTLAAGGQLPGGAFTRVAGTAVATDGDPTAIALSLAGAAVENSQALSDLTSRGNITVDGTGINMGLGDSGLQFGFNSSLDFGGSFSFQGGSVDLREGGDVTLNLQHGDYRGSITDDGAFTLQQNLANFGQDGSTTWGGFSVGEDGSVSLVADQSVRGPDTFTTFTSGIIDLRTGEATTTVTNNASFADVLDQFNNGTPPSWFVPLLPNIRTGDPEVPGFETPAVTGDLELYEEERDFSPPEEDEYTNEIVDNAAAIAPPGPMEEVVVVGQYLGPDTPLTTAPTPSQGDRDETDRAPGEGGLSSEEEMDKAKEDVFKAGVELQKLAGSPLAAAGSDVLAIEDAMAKVQAAFEDPTPQNIMAAQAAVNGVLGNLAEMVEHPDAAMARRVSAFSSCAAALDTLFLDPDASLNDKMRAAVTVAGALGGPQVKTASEVFLAANDLGSALHTFGNSAGAIDPETGLTPFEETADEALAVELAARAKGEAFGSAISAAGPATAAAIQDLTGLDLSSEVQGIFDGIGAETSEFFSDIGHAAAVTHVVTSALGDALEGSIRATVAGWGD